MNNHAGHHDHAVPVHASLAGLVVAELFGPGAGSAAAFGHAVRQRGGQSAGGDGDLQGSAIRPRRNRLVAVVIVALTALFAAAAAALVTGLPDDQHRCHPAPFEAAAQSPIDHCELLLEG